MDKGCKWLTAWSAFWSSPEEEVFEIQFSSLCSKRYGDELFWKWVFLYWMSEEYPGKRGWVNLSCVWRVFKIEFDSNEVAKTWKYYQMLLFHGMNGVFLINWKPNTELSSVPLENSRPEIYFLDSARWSYSTLSTATWWNHLYCNSLE